MNSDPARPQISDGHNPGADHILELEPLGHDMFRSVCTQGPKGGHLFGGQVFAQALAAAGRTVEGRACHSAHGYFLRAGSASRPVEFTVARIRDGARFATRRVVGTQDGREILDLLCSFHVDGTGLEHQVVNLPDVPPPASVPDLVSLPLLGEADGLAGEIEVVREFPHVELKLIDHDRARQPDPAARRQYWIRIAGAASSDDPARHQQYLAYLSDFLLSQVATVPHPLEYRLPHMAATSLDHAIWFHRHHRCDEWLFYDCHSSISGSGRAMTEGRLFDRGGQLVATVMQEVFLHPAAQ